MWSAIKKRIPVVLQTPAVEAYGNCAEEIYWGLLRARRENKKVIFIFVWDLFGPFVFSKNHLGVNATLKRVTSPFRLLNENHIPIILISTTLTILYSGVRLIGLLGQKCLRLYSWHKTSNFAGNILRSLVEFGAVQPSINRSGVWPIRLIDIPFGAPQNPWVVDINSPIEIDLPVSELNLGRQLADKMGLPTGAPFVCLHVRETGFYGVREGRGKTTRNGSIETYFGAIQYLTSRGYWVVRLGDRTMTKLPAMDCVIDYPFTSVKNHLMDVWLVRNCESFIGQDSGPTSVAILFQKPIIMANIVDICCGFPFRRRDIGIPKHVYSKKEDKYLSVSEIVERSLSNYNDFINDKDMVYVENSLDEITNLVREYFESSEQRGRENIYFEYQAKLLEQRQRFNQNIDWLSKLSDVEKGRFLALFSASNGSIAGRYLIDNYQNDSLN